MKTLLKILLIDNDLAKPSISGEKLEQNNMGFKIDTVDSPIQALSRLVNHSFNGVLIKYPLSKEHSGVSLIKKISSLGEAIPIIILSAQENESLAVEMIRAGAYDYLSEPRITPKIIHRSLHQGIRIHKAETKVKQVNSRLRKRNQLLRKKNRELHRQREKIKLQNLQLQQAYQLKSQFLSTLSHELRTPMNAIIGFSQILLSNYPDPLTPNQINIVQRIYSNSENLLTMINDVLDFSELETGKVNMKLEEFNLENFIRISVEEIRSLAQQKNLILDFELELSNPMIINDRFFCRSIIINLVSNAIKFTSEGRVLVKARELNEDQIAITIADTGIGIAPESLQTIFEPFRQVEQTLNRRYQGTGLGLAIVDSLVKMMGGQIEVQSKLNEGSTFRVTIPRTVPS